MAAVKRTTIMVEEEMLYDLQQIAQAKAQSMASVLREALAVYITEQQKVLPARNPLLDLIGIGASAEPTDVADGGDEMLLRDEIRPIEGWSVDREHAG
jgi:hypothetical protein